METGFFFIAILGCGDASLSCTPVATVPTQYSSKAACAAATGDALLRNADLDFPQLLAECRPAARPASATKERPLPVPAGALAG